MAFALRGQDGSCAMPRIVETDMRHAGPVAEIFEYAMQAALLEGYAYGGC
jgi:hypothetical protein